MCFVNTVFRCQSSLIAILASQESFRISSSRCLAHAWICPQRIIRRPMVKLSTLIDSPEIFLAVLVLSRQSLGTSYSLSLKLRRATPLLPLLDLLHYKWVSSRAHTFHSRYHCVVLGLVGERLLKSSLLLSISLCSNRCTILLRATRL